MESIVEDPNNRTDSDRFRLASLYVQNAQFLQGQSGKEKQVKQLFDSAERQLKLATENSQAPIEFLYAYADFLLDQKQTTGARSVFDRMNTQSADNFATVLMKTRLQVLEGKSEQASKTLEEWLSAKKSALPRGYTPTQMAELLSLAGQGMQMIGSSARAEELLREAYELDSRAGLNYVRSLSRSNNSTARENAIRFLMKRASENKNSESMQMLATMLSVGETNPELLENAERLLRQVNTSNDSDLNVLLSVADYWLSKNKQSDAIEIYRRVIQMRPNDVVALNNISNLLAEDPGSIEEALGYIEQALRIAGRQPLLLDTKAVLLMNSGRVEEAIPVLEMAIASSDDPRLKLHMFIALRNANRIADANRVAAAININQLKNTLLTPSDQRELNLLLEGNK
jgi:tetratricopeptide (TPR) repeat protein